MQDTMGFAILGVGGIADVHAQAVKSAAETGARLVAIGHHAPEKVRDPEGRFGVPCLTEDELLAREDVDVVCICTPSGQHARQAITAARAGKHVLVEKPMAMTLADADEMIEACEEAGVKLGVTLQRRAEEPFKRLGEAIRNGDLGRLVSGSVSVPYYRDQDYYAQAPWRGTREMDGGVLMNQGIHLLDLLLWYMGDPVSVTASAGTLAHDIEAEDTLTATLTFPGGALATVNATTAAAPGFPHQVEVYGTRGGVQIEGDAVRRWKTGDAQEEGGVTGEAGAGSSPTALSVEGHASLYRDFARAILNGTEPLVSGREGRRSLVAVLKVYESLGI